MLQQNSTTDKTGTKAIKLLIELKVSEISIKVLALIFFGLFFYSGDPELSSAILNGRQMTDASEILNQPKQ